MDAWSHFLISAGLWWGCIFNKASFSQQSTSIVEPTDDMWRKKSGHSEKANSVIGYARAVHYALVWWLKLSLSYCNTHILCMLKKTILNAAPIRGGALAFS